MKLLRDMPLFDEGVPLGSGTGVKSSNPLMSLRVDSLGFDAYASTLTKAVLGTEGPFAIGVYADWGCGKTSLMRMMQQCLDNEHQQDVLTIWFNAWQYESEPYVIIPLVREIAEASEDTSIGQMKTRDRVFRETLRLLSESLYSVLNGITLHASAGLPYASAGIEFSGARVAKLRTSQRSRKRKLDGLVAMESIYAQVYGAIEDVRLPHGKRVVVFLDDLDRCLPGKALQVLESLKLVFSQKGYIFVIGVAGTVLEGFLDYRYKKEYGMKDYDGKSYLDKIIQLQFRIPPPTGDRLRVFTESLIAEYPEFAGLEDIVELGGGENPRAMIRFVNGLIVDRSINEARVKSKSQTNFAYLAIGRALYMRWRTVYDLLISLPRLCGIVARWSEQDIASRTVESQIPRDETEFTQEIVRLARDMQAHPGLKKLLLHPKAQEWLGTVAEDAGESEGPEANVFLTQFEEGEMRDVGSEKRFDAFFSYRVTDKNYVGRVAGVLSESGLRIAWDADLTPGMDWAKALERALSESRAILYFVGKDSTASEWQAREKVRGIEMAERDPSFRFVPILLPGAVEIPDEIRRYFYVDLREFPETDPGLVIALKDVIRSLRPSRSGGAAWR